MNHYNEDCHFISSITLVRLSVKRVPKLFDDCSKIDVYSMLDSIEFRIRIHVCVGKTETVIPRLQGGEVNLKGELNNDSWH